MALACQYIDHPVGDGTFCRICGRSYIDVPDPFVHVDAEPVPWEALAPAPASVLAPTSPMFPGHARSLSTPPAGSVPPALGLLPEVRLAEVSDEVVDDVEAADQVDGHAFVDDSEDAAEPDAVHRAGRVSQSHLLAVAGFGGGALVMALLDRLVL